MLPAQPPTDWEYQNGVPWFVCHYVYDTAFGQVLRTVLPFCLFLFSGNDIESTYHLRLQNHNIISLCVQVDRM